MNSKIVALKCAVVACVLLLACPLLQAQEKTEEAGFEAEIPLARVGPEDEASQQILVRRRNFQAEVKLYPVPAADELKISAPDIFKGDTQVLLYDKHGQTYWMQTITAEALKDFKLDLYKINLSSGVYYIRLLNNGNSITSKFIKE